MAYDPADGHVVLFGGYFASACNGDTWEFDGTDWTPGSAGPGARCNHAMVYDAARARIVLFGGGSSADTWEYDGASWSGPVSTTTTPPGGSDSAMSYDVARRRVVWFGSLGDTWKAAHDGERHGMPLGDGAKALLAALQGLSLLLDLGLGGLFLGEIDHPRNHRLGAPELDRARRGRRQEDRAVAALLPVL
jgi:hypothetical protein